MSNKKTEFDSKISEESRIKFMQGIYQIELTNYCNLKCTYCPLSVSKRPKGYMTDETFIKILDHIAKNKQKLLILHHFGEPLLHPELEKFVSLAVKRGFIPGFATNGIALTEKRFISLVNAGLCWMCVSLHSKKSLEAYYRVLPLAQKGGCVLFARNFMDNTFYLGKGMIVETVPKHDFAGTAPDKIVRQIPSLGHLNCDFLEKNYYSILYDGTVVACCMDESGVTARGNIDNITKIRHNEKYKICADCHGMRFYGGLIVQERFLKLCLLANDLSLGMGLISNIHIQRFIRRFLGKYIPNLFV